ncbi:hypothetical protein D4764_19G0006480 [Takifugu flavidus]|uniref:Uncharacterized protein n=1 Tax=Takifugu flavidus TaxID=433684 RepID=A0A5C6NRW9_9TELE|nr:hypothetical protein D4764_19G0006480 [Takifugu flavidus]
MDMGRERLTKGLLLRFGLLSAAVLLCIHVYLKTPWRGTPAVQMLAGPIRSSQDRRQHSGDQRDSAGPNRGVKSRVSYIRTLKRNGPATRRDGDGEELPTPCCLPRRPRRKIGWLPITCRARSDSGGRLLEMGDGKQSSAVFQTSREPSR